MNRATWTNLRLPTPVHGAAGHRDVGRRRRAAQGPKVPPGTYTVKVSSGSWSETQTFRLAHRPAAIRR